MIVRKSYRILSVVVLLLVAIGMAVLIYYLVTNSGSDTDDVADVTAPVTPSSSAMGVYSQAAIVSLGAPCAAIGKSMLEAGGNAVDAAIATLLCDGVCVLQSMGVGGGFIMTLYNKTENKTYSLIAREVAPAAATQDMYVNNASGSTFGAIAAAVPGELRGYQAVHERFGKLPWSDLFQPTIQLCEQGIPVSKQLAEDFTNYQHVTPSFKEIILDPMGGFLPKEGDTFKLPLLAQTLRLIANSSLKADELYNGSLTEQFVSDIQTAGGIITVQDMNSYSVRWEEPYNASLSGGVTLYSAALPGSGVLVAFMTRLLDGKLQREAFSDVQRSELIIEAFKHAYGRRTDLGDPHFVNSTLLEQVLQELTEEVSIQSIRDKIKVNFTSNNVSFYGAHYSWEDSGTDNIAVIDTEGNAISVTSTINTKFGSKFVSTSTGILLNNEMDDFSTPGQENTYGFRPSEANYIVGGKRPQSSMSPTVVVDSEGRPRLVVGGAGGSLITSQVTNVIINNLWFGKNIKEAIDLPRFHHQLLPMQVIYEYGVLESMVEAWQTAGHKTRRKEFSDPHLAVVTGIARLGDNLTANCDWRKPGSVDGL